ncbi:MAG: biotin--[acetyl-CoA-carboxylase] ligase [Desulfobacterales bacterium]|nr:biotin--[acetyl-CoA-carboxylase] ligase [Desulfobacterales bacterium]
MDLAWVLLEKNILKEWDSIIADKQTRGKGQHNREWISAKGNLYGSIILPNIEELSARWQSFIPLTCGYVITQTLKLFGIDSKLKWPNDIIIGNRKIGGILIEKKNKTIVGVGLNFTTYPSDEKLRDEFSLKATSIVKEGFNLYIEEFWIKFILLLKNFFYNIIYTNNEEEENEFIKLINSKFLFINQKVKVFINKDDVKKGFFKGISNDGGIIISGDSEEIIYSGRLVPDINNLTFK